MPTRIFHYALVSLCIALLIGQMGCSHRVVISPLRPAPLSEPVRAQLGTVGVVSARYSPEVNIEVRPVVGNSGSSEGAGKGALAGTAVGAGSALTVLPYALYFPPLLIVAGAMVVVGAVGGAIAGAIYGSDDIEEAPESFEDAELAFEKASDDPIVQVAMRDQVIQASQGLPSHNVVLLGDEGLSPPGDKADYDAWARRGIDSVLETQVENVTLLVEEGFDPLLALDMSVEGESAPFVSGVPMACSLSQQGCPVVTNRLQRGWWKNCSWSMIPRDRPAGASAECILERWRLILCSRRLNGKHSRGLAFQRSIPKES